MAVITPTTFNPLNDFVRVRLAQGVVITDADVNERDDIHMFELRAALRWFVGDGVPDPSDAFRVEGTGAPNDVTIRAGVPPAPAGASLEERALRHVGRCLVGGLDVAIAADATFRAQALHVSRGAPATALAAALGVPTIAEMPVLAGTVVAYLDVWERLVTPTEAPGLVLPGLGTESCARVKREWVVRTRAGTKAPVPAEADYQTGHGYYALATLARRSGDPNVAAADVTDRRQTGLTLVALAKRVRRLETLLLLVPSFGPPGNQLAPVVGTPGTEVTLSGRNFAVGPPQVQFGAFNATLVSAPTPTQIVARVPAGPLGAVRVRVRMAGGSVLSDDTFNVLPPPPVFGPPGNQFTPKNGAPNVTVTLNGNNFNFQPVSVRFGTIQASIVGTPTATVIVVRVPTGILLQNVPIEVRTAGGTVQSADTFFGSPP